MAMIGSVLRIKQNSNLQHRKKHKRAVAKRDSPFKVVRMLYDIDQLRIPRLCDPVGAKILSHHVEDLVSNLNGLFICKFLVFQNLQHG